MIRSSLIFVTGVLASGVVLTACGSAPNTNFQPFQPLPGQGQYVRPAFLNAELPPRLPPTDACRSQLYQGLVTQHEGSIVFTGLPGRVRVVKPANLEAFGYDQDDFLFTGTPLVEVTEYLADQTLYAPSITNLADRFNLGPEFGDRITIELDQEGYVQAVGCG